MDRNILPGAYVAHDIVNITMLILMLCKIFIQWSIRLSTNQKGHHLVIPMVVVTTIVGPYLAEQRCLYHKLYAQIKRGGYKDLRL